MLRTDRLGELVSHRCALLLRSNLNELALIDRTNEDSSCLMDTRTTIHIKREILNSVSILASGKDSTLSKHIHMSVEELIILLSSASGLTRLAHRLKLARHLLHNFHNLRVIKVVSLSELNEGGQSGETSNLSSHIGSFRGVGRSPFGFSAFPLHQIYYSFSLPTGLRTFFSTNPPQLDVLGCIM